MATLDELQAQLAALTQRVDEITAPPDDYYTHRFSGEEIDNAVDRVKATPGSGAITAEDVGAAPAIEDTNNPGCYYHMVDGVQEWLNPPMVLGVEYRTTERNNKKPVYKKIVSIGNLPNTSAITVSHNSENVLAAISGDLYNQDGTLLNLYHLIAQFTVGRVAIVIRTIGDMSSNIGTVSMKYTKTTD